MKCPNCNEYIPDNSGYCTSCGYNTDRVPEINPQDIKFYSKKELEELRIKIYNYLIP